MEKILSCVITNIVIHMCHYTCRCTTLFSIAIIKMAFFEWLEKTSDKNLMF